MLERFARGKQLTQENPLLAIVIIPRKNRKFNVNFRMSLIYYKTVCLVHIAMKDGLGGKGKIIPWLKILISGHFISYPCTPIKIRCEKVNSAHPIIKLPQSALNKDLRVEAKEITLPCLPAGHSQHSFLNILGISKYQLGISVSMTLPTLHLLLSASCCSGEEICMSIF